MSVRFPAPRTGAAFRPRLLRGIAAVAAAPLLLLLTVTLGCSVEETSAHTAADSVTVTEQWAKAADSGMSAAFAEVRNSGGQPVTLVSASSPVSARVELHEVVTGADGATVMRQKHGGFVITAGEALELEPGGAHLMFMDLHGPLRTGSEAPITLGFDDGSTITFTAGVRDFSGNQENYDPGHGEEHSG
ncbi:copper chaperone PCu(A)C [Nocardia donostiensis]|uniref:copper chaperone PCu(A)C n=1 Tax=Nocardia donostiensis TaxID=1538463 RepID=UPI0009DA5EC5|nr:copper chaperone PCu(A)C [Nocardia donostiensis]